MEEYENLQYMIADPSTFAYIDRMKKFAQLFDDNDLKAISNDLGFSYYYSNIVDDDFFLKPIR